MWLAAVVALALLWLQVLRLEHAQRRAAQAAHTARAAVAFAIDLAAARLACHLDPDPQSPQIQPPTPWADARVSLHIDDHSLRHDPTNPASAVPVVPGGHALKTSLTPFPASAPDLLPEPPPAWLNTAHPPGDVLDMASTASWLNGPLLLQWSVAAGVYAATAEGPGPERTIRLRFFLDGLLLNPYDRPLRLPAHSAGRNRPVFRIVLDRLPSVQLENRTLGIVSDWTDLDLAANEGRAGETRLAAWIEARDLPRDNAGHPVMPPGAILRITEPDPARQPEGLARLLWRRFPVQAGDYLRLRLRPHPDGLRLRLLPYTPTVEADGYANIPALVTWEGMPLPDQQLDWPWAADPAQPFLLTGSSADYRRQHCRLFFGGGWRADRFHAASRLIDPRRRHLAWSAILPDDGAQPAAPLADWLYAGWNPPDQEWLQEVAWHWPDLPPQSFADLRWTPSGNRSWLGLGTTAAGPLNSIVDSHWFAHRRAPDGTGWIPRPDLIASEAPDGPLLGGVFNVHCPDATAWRAFFASIDDGRDRSPLAALWAAAAQRGPFATLADWIAQAGCDDPEIILPVLEHLVTAGDRFTVRAAAAVSDPADGRTLGRARTAVILQRLPPDPGRPAAGRPVAYQALAPVDRGAHE